MSDPHARLQVTTTKGKTMTTLSLPISLIESDERMVCVFCDDEVNEEMAYCPKCMDYKGIMTIAEWEDYTGEKWED
jgi:hypothetical protein